MKNKLGFLLSAAAIVLTLGACGTQKTVTDGRTAATQAASATDKQTAQTVTTTENLARRVASGAVYAKNISSKITFRLQTGDKDITVPGQLRMRKDDVIRIQLLVPLLGSEIGRLEFTKDYVLVIDRMHKEYIKGDYNQIDFLRDNGLNFNALQAIFWNELFIPGEGKLTDALLEQLTADVQKGLLSYEKGNMTCEWQTEAKTAHITKTAVTYRSDKHGTSRLDVDYDDFTAVGIKQFPKSENLHFTTAATKKKKDVTVSLQLSDIDTSADWENRTTVSSKYKQVSTDDVLGKLSKL